MINNIFDSDEEDVQIEESVDDKCKRCIELEMELEQVKADLKIHKDCFNSVRKKLDTLDAMDKSMDKDVFLLYVSDFLILFLGS